MNTTENNKLIAEFLCTTQRTLDLDDCYIFKGMAYHIEDLPFNKDWNWLMEVIKKIAELGVFVFYDSNKFYKLISQFKIESSYKACIDFIKWYNEKNRNY